MFGQRFFRVRRKASSNNSQHEHTVFMKNEPDSSEEKKEKGNERIQVGGLRNRRPNDRHLPSRKQIHKSLARLCFDSRFDCAMMLATDQPQRHKNRTANRRAELIKMN